MTPSPLALLRARYLALALTLGLFPLLALWVLVSPAQAGANTCFTEYTGDNATDFSSGGSLAVRQALAVAPSGAFIKVAGTCVGAFLAEGTVQLAHITRTVTLRGGYTPTNWITSYPLTQPTTLDALANGRVIYVNAPATLENLRLVNGYAEDAPGGGLYAARPVTLTNLLVSGNTVTGTTGDRVGGGAFFLESAIINNSTFELNFARGAGGGLFAADDAHLNTVSILDNTAQGGGGGALFDGSTTLLYTSFRDNHSSGGPGGGGGYFDSTALLTDVVFSNNTHIPSAVLAAGQGPPIFNSLGGGALFGDNVELLRVSFSLNTAGHGGGAAFTDPAVLSGTTFYRNMATQGGGGAFFTDNGHLEASLFIENTSPTGGGAWLQRGLTISATRFVSNTAVVGGGLYVSGDHLPRLIANTLFAGNTTTETSGVALHYTSATSLTVLHVTVASSRLVTGSAVYLAGGGAVYLTNTLIANHTVGFDRGIADVFEDYSLFSGVATPYSGGLTPGAHSFTGTAGFVNPATGAYYLLAHSDAIDAGADAGLTLDLVGELRPRGLGFDIGAYEFDATLVWLPLVLR